MTSSIAFYASQIDREILESFAISLGLCLVSPTVGRPVNADAALGPFCYLSAVAESELHPYGKPPVRISDARDPMLSYMRSYFERPFLVLGHIQHSDDVRALAQVTRPYYSKLSRWIKSSWACLPGGDIYIGADAQRLVENGAQMANAVPGTFEFHRIESHATGAL